MGLGMQRPRLVVERCMGRELELLWELLVSGFGGKGMRDRKDDEFMNQ
jgi:hypothetical protein